MSLTKLLQRALDKTAFSTVADYIDFCLRFLEFSQSGLQARIVSLNESHYHFFQYKDDGKHAVSRPFNTRLMYEADKAEIIETRFPETFKNAKLLSADDIENRQLLRNSIYTIQQSIGITLDANTSSNAARKIAGDLFERFIRLLICELGVDCKSGVIGIPVVVQNVEAFKMNYQHDLVIRRDGHLKTLGSVKTSSKDRIDKIFIDKFLYSRLTETQLPHVAIFLNDVQRRGKHPKYGINATFLPGHFKGYSIKLNPLDGVYYCDLRPNMTLDPYLKTQIHPIDQFFCNDLWKFLQAAHPDVEQAEPVMVNVIEPGEEAEQKGNA